MRWSAEWSQFNFGVSTIFPANFLYFAEQKRTLPHLFVHVSEWDWHVFYRTVHLHLRLRMKVASLVRACSENEMRQTRLDFADQHTCLPLFCWAPDPYQLEGIANSRFSSEGKRETMKERKRMKARGTAGDSLELDSICENEATTARYATTVIAFARSLRNSISSRPTFRVESCSPSQVLSSVPHACMKF